MASAGMPGRLRNSYENSHSSGMVLTAIPPWIWLVVMVENGTS
ncbi:Uncharacterised protein [Bordetella pertussis]|nr:Uncharacterised protein [Bordetella pertussis]CPO37236.1 Uncharacterised protein [Bordetella pertussis]